MKIPSDLKEWYAISCPVKGLRFDARTLEFLDVNHDGHIRTEELQAAFAFLKSKGVDPETLGAPDPEDQKKLDGVLAQLAELERREPSAEDRAALAAWEAEGRKSEIAVCGEGTAAADAALAAVEPVIDAFFTPAEEMPLVTEEPDPVLPLRERLNPKHLEAVLDFAEKCVKPVLGEKTSLTRLEWKRVKAAFAPYRAWTAAKPVMNAGAKAALEEEEKLLRYRLNLGEFMINYVTMDRLYGGDPAIFQTGVLRIDGRELNLCFHVESEAAHSALSGKSDCCVIYLKLTRPGSGEERGVGAVVTAGALAGLYVGRNGVFYDRDGLDWEAVITKVVENQISLVEAFWAPWRKLGEAVAGMVKKFLGDRQTKSMDSVSKGTESAQAGGAAMASSVAAIGIGIGMVGAAAASLMAAISTMTPLRLAIAIVALVLIVSLPSVILTWFKLRRRDLGAVLNASGWAVNRRMRFSMKRAKRFTVCRKRCHVLAWLLLVLLLAGLGAAVWYRFRPAPAAAATQEVSNTNTNEVQNAQN